MISKNSFLCWWLLCWSSLTMVNAQDTSGVKPPRPKSKYDLKWNVSGRRLTGTFEQFVFASGLDIRFDNHRWAIHSNTSYRFNELNGQTIENNWYQLLTLSYYVKNKTVFPTIFYHYDNNLMFRVNGRNLFGAGLSTVKQWKGQLVRLDVGAGYDNTDYNGAQFENSDWNPGSSRKRRLFLVRLFHENRLFKNKVFLSNSIFYRHSLEESSDYFMTITPRISVKVFKNLSFSVSYEYRVENVHLSELSYFNTVLLYGLTYRLAN